VGSSFTGGLAIVLSPHDNTGFRPGLQACSFSLGAGFSFSVPRPDGDSVRYLSAWVRAAAPADTSSPGHGHADDEAGTRQELAATLAR
jgi:hypothetical protein